MSERIEIKRKGVAFRIRIDLPLEPAKAQAVATIVEEDAGRSKVTIGGKRRLLRVKVKGLVSPASMRRILQELAR